MKRKRVLVFTETALALSETFIADHCRALQNYEPTLVALYRSGDHHTDVERHVLYPSGRPGARIRLAFRLGSDPRLHSLIASTRPDIIHAHYLTNGAFLRPYATRHGIPLVVTAHGHDVTRQLGKRSVYDQLFHYQRWRLARSEATILPVSNHLRSKLLSYGFRSDHVQTHYLGIPLDPDPPVEVSLSPPIILFVGRLVEKKGIDTLIEAFATVRSARQDAELHIVGDGPLRALVQGMASKVGGIVLHGAQPPDRTRQIMRSASVLALPNRRAWDGDEEGFGLVLIEAQGLGIPVVTAQDSATSEAVLSGKTGLAIEPADKDQLAKALLMLLHNPDLARTMGAQAHSFVRETFDIRRQTQKLEQHYDAILARWTIST